MLKLLMPPTMRPPSQPGLQATSASSVLFGAFHGGPPKLGMDTSAMSQSALSGTGQL